MHETPKDLAPLNGAPTHRFIMIPLRARGDSSLTAADWRILTALAKRATHHDRTASERPTGTLSLRALAQAAHVTKTTASKRTNSLAQRGYLRIEHTFHGGERSESRFFLLMGEVLSGEATLHDLGVVHAGNTGVVRVDDTCVARADNEVLPARTTKSSRPSLKTNTDRVPAELKRESAKRAPHSGQRRTEFTPELRQALVANGIVDDDAILRDYFERICARSRSRVIDEATMVDWAQRERDPVFKPGASNGHDIAGADNRRTDATARRLAGLAGFVGGGT